MRHSLVTFSLIIATSTAWGFYPEYEHFTDPEREEINRPRQVGSEYESDRLTYQFLNQWNGIFINEKNVFQYTAGSLGPSRFFTQGRIRFRKDISETWAFQLAYANRGNARTHRQSLIFEFFFKIQPWWEISIYGEPSTLKKQDDVGLANTFHFSKNSNLRLYYTWVDFSHNKRNELDDVYDQQPGSVGAIWRQNKDDRYIQASFRKDFSTQQRFISAGRIYQFAATEAQWLSRHALDNSRTRFLQTEFNYSRSHEADNIRTDNGITRWENETADGMVQIQQPHSWLQLLGIRSLYSHWQSAQGDVIHNNILPHSWFRPWSWQVGAYQHSLDVGYEFTWHRGQGAENLRSQLDRNDVLEHRMNWRYHLVAGEHTRFNVLLTFDLDEFGTGETWEGGAMQFSTTF